MKAPALDVPGAPAVGELVGRMLALRPVERPRDGSEVLATLAPIQQEMERHPPVVEAAVRMHRRSPAFFDRLAELTRRPVFRVSLALGLLAAAAGFGWYSVRHRQSSPAGERTTATPVAPATASIAVLPFADMSPQHDQEYFSDGIAEEISSALSRVDGLHVVGRTSSFFFKGKDVVSRFLRSGASQPSIPRRDGKSISFVTSTTGDPQFWTAPVDGAPWPDVGASRRAGHPFAPRGTAHCL